MIFVGLGAGRTGTASLTGLINSQKDAICFHELNPTCAHFSENFAPLKNTITEFAAILDGGDTSLLTLDYSRPVSVKSYEKLKTIEHPKLIGDVAYYYLNYVEEIHNLNNQIKFICLYRDKASNVQSWINKTTIHRWPSLWLADRLKSLITRTPFYKERNFWQEHDGSVWQPDPVWDKTFPKFEASTKKEAIEKYWDFYYAKAESLKQKLPNHFMIIDVKRLSTPEGQKEVLKFLGIPEDRMNLLSDCHNHKSE